MACTRNREFDLHVWKKLGDAEKPDLYTIGIWNEEQYISSLCHIQPIEVAIGVIRKVLEEAGKPVNVPQLKGFKRLGGCMRDAARVDTESRKT